MKLCFSKIACPGVFRKNMITISTGKGTWVLASPPPSGVTMAPYSYEKFPGDTSQKGLLCLNFSEYHPPPLDPHPFHKMLTTSGLEAISLCRYS